MNAEETFESLMEQARNWSPPMIKPKLTSDHFAAIDLTGQRFGKWTVIRISHYNHYGANWFVRCGCSYEKVVRGTSLNSGQTLGCLQCARRDAVIDLTGQEFGSWTVVSRGGSSGKKLLWKCICNCGNTSFVDGYNLRNKLSTGCRSCARQWYSDRTEAAFNSLWYIYSVLSARNRGHEWILTRDQFRDLITGNCFYCNSQPSQKKDTGRNSTFLYNGIDRVDNSKPYIISNVVTCCKRCNYIKNDSTFKEFENIYLKWKELVDART